MTYFEQVAEVNRRRTKGGYEGMGSVPWPDSSLAPVQNQDNPAYKTIYGTPGRQWMNACRTRQNPWGWVVGTGGNQYPTPMDITYTDAQWQAMQFDALLNNAVAVKAQGGGCPTNDAQLAAALAASPFLHPTAFPGQSNTPLVGWSGGYVANPVVSAKSNSSGGNVISFSSSNRGDNTFFPGEAWSIVIKGAKPNASVSANNNGGGFTNFGSTDSNGNWSKTGTFASSDIGSWNETWMVDNSVIGSWAFNISVAQSQQTAQSSGASQQTNTTNPTTASDLASSASTLGSDWVGILEGSAIGGIPNWILLAGGALVLFSMMGGRK